jgi:hypothetical protein
MRSRFNASSTHIYALTYTAYIHTRTNWDNCAANGDSDGNSYTNTST